MRPMVKSQSNPRGTADLLGAGARAIKHRFTMVNELDGMVVFVDDFQVHDGIALGEPVPVRGRSRTGSSLVWSEGAMAVTDVEREGGRLAVKHHPRPRGPT